MKSFYAHPNPTPGDRKEGTDHFTKGCNDFVLCGIVVSFFLYLSGRLLTFHSPALSFSPLLFYVLLPTLQDEL